MHLGEKIRDTRHGCGLSQEQLADRLCVSRSAIAKWETGKGMPDIENLKALAKLLGVSVDSLLEDRAEPGLQGFFRLEQYGRGCKRVRKDRVIRQAFPQARIIPLLGRSDPAPFQALPDCGGEGRSTSRQGDRAFYLVEQQDTQYFVTVEDTRWEARPTEPRITADRFRLDDWDFIRSNYEVAY